MFVYEYSKVPEMSVVLETILGQGGGQRRVSLKYTLVRQRETPLRLGLIVAR